MTWVKNFLKRCRIALFVLIMIFSTASTASGVFAAVSENQAPLPRLLIVYADESVQEKAAIVVNLADHFRLQPETAPLAGLGDSRIAQADFMIFISSSSPRLRKTADERFAKVTRPLLWIGEPSEESNSDTISAIRYTYKQHTFTERSSPVFRLPSHGRPDRTLAEASDGNVTVPLLFGNGNRWYFATGQLFGTAGIILADGLHEFFGQAHEEKHEGFIRIEDVHPLVEPERLMKIADLLYARHIPYMVAVIPVYVNPKTGEHIQMGERPELVRALKYMSDHGASFIMHGYTHQYRTSETGEGFEFWDSIRDAPIENEASYNKDKLERGLATMVYNGIYPVAFEPPHYTMSQAGYSQMSRYFSTLVAQLQVSDRTYQLTQRPPYRLNKERHGLRVIPETVGYVLNQPGYPELMRPVIEQTLLVRDSVVGAFFHPYLPIEKLEELLDIMDAYPLDFIDLKKEDNWVASDFLQIKSSDQGIQLTVKDRTKLTQLGAPPETEKRGLLSKMTFVVTWGIAILVIAFLALFVLLIVRLNRRRRAALFIERKADGL